MYADHPTSMHFDYPPFRLDYSGDGGPISPQLINVYWAMVDPNTGESVDCDRTIPDLTAFLDTNAIKLTPFKFGPGTYHLCMYHPYQPAGMRKHEHITVVTYNRPPSTLPLPPPSPPPSPPSVATAAVPAAPKSSTFPATQPTSAKPLRPRRHLRRRPRRLPLPRLHQPATIATAAIPTAAIAAAAQPAPSSPPPSPPPPSPPPPSPPPSEPNLCEVYGFTEELAPAQVMQICNAQQVIVQVSNGAECLAFAIARAANNGEPNGVQAQLDAQSISESSPGYCMYNSGLSGQWELVSTQSPVSQCDSTATCACKPELEYLTLTGTPMSNVRLGYDTNYAGAVHTVETCCELCHMEAPPSAPPNPPALPQSPAAPPGDPAAPPPPPRPLYPPGTEVAGQAASAIVQMSYQCQGIAISEDGYCYLYSDLHVVTAREQVKSKQIFPPCATAAAIGATDGHMHAVQSDLRRAATGSKPDPGRVANHCRLW